MKAIELPLPVSTLLLVLHDLLRVRAPPRSDLLEDSERRDTKTKPSVD
jgi:hypothetical protein